MQYNDGIYSASLNDKKKFKLIVSGEYMVRRQLLRGYDGHIFFAESAENTEKIYRL